MSEYCCGEFEHHVERGEILWNENGKYSNWGIYAGFPELNSSGKVEIDRQMIFDISFCPFCGEELTKPEKA